MHPNDLGGAYVAIPREAISINTSKQLFYCLAPLVGGGLGAVIYLGAASRGGGVFQVDYLRLGFVVFLDAAFFLGAAVLCCKCRAD